MTTERVERVLTPAELGDHWQGHRRLTRRLIEAVPEKELFEFSIGGMRPISELARELMGLSGSGIRGIARGDWVIVPELDYHGDHPGPATKAELLQQWDAVTAEIDALWPSIPASRFDEVDAAFGEYEGPIWSHVLYWIDNEVHHRGQAYVYLRALGIEPPPFWDQ